MITFGSDRTGTSQVFLMNADGSNLRRGTQTTAKDAQPTWAPDNVRLAFASNLPGNYDVYRIGVDGSNRVRLTTNAASTAIRNGPGRRWRRSSQRAPRSR